LAFGVSVAKSSALEAQARLQDLAYIELLELVDATCEGRAREVTLEYWSKSLAINTGNDEISNLIYWPEQYLGHRYEGHELTPAETGHRAEQTAVRRK
jgi:hypothetical protein